jgi:hypothetical protein
VLLRLDEGAVGEKRLSILNADGGSGLDLLQLVTAKDGRQLADRVVPAEDRVLLSRIAE